MNSGKPNYLNIGFGLAFLVAFGVLIADRADVIDIKLGIVAPLVLVIVGALIAVRGLVGTK
jgi:hypothetical protein